MGNHFPNGTLDPGMAVVLTANPQDDQEIPRAAPLNRPVITKDKVDYHDNPLYVRVKDPPPRFRRNLVSRDHPHQ